MNRILFFGVAMVVAFVGHVSWAADVTAPTDLRCEYQVNPEAIDVLRPRLSWTLEPGRRGRTQKAYRILAATTSEQVRADRADLWDSGKVESSESIQIEYAGKVPASRQSCWWKVRIWEADGSESPWSEPARWIMGLLNDADWKARWITFDIQNAPSVEGCPWVWFPEGDPIKAAPPGKRYFRKVVELPAGAKVLQGRFVIAVDNKFVLSVNGKQVGKGQDWSVVTTTDVSDVLKTGANILAVVATNDLTAPNPAGLAGRLVVTLEGGSTLNVPIDGSWKVSDKESAQWRQAGFDDSTWPAAKELGKVGIEPWGVPERGPGTMPIFRREFTVDKDVRQACVRICGLGQYELRLNGRRVGDREIDPGWTNYRKRCLYSTYDITKDMMFGSNTLGVMLGNGMYNVVGGRYLKFKGSFGPLKVIVQLDIDYADGTSVQIVSDESWKAVAGPVVFSCTYGGEDYDARNEPNCWCNAGFDDSAWASAKVVSGPGGRLFASSAPPIKVIRTFTPVKVTEPFAGALVYDLGQNFSGRPQIRVKGPAGMSLKITPAEKLDEQGRANQKSSGGPTWYTYTLGGKGVEEWHPKFIYYGSRYYQIEGGVRPDTSLAESTGKPVILDVEGQLLHASAEPVGEFACSNPLFTRIHELITWAVRSNMQSVLTDCPHREKLGWLEEAHLMAPGVLYNFHVPALYGKIIQDMAEAQLDNGLVPDIAPEYVVFSGAFRDSPEWGSAYVIVPWYTYQTYGDLRVLGSHYPGMKRYVDYLTTQAKDHIISYGLGDWCDIGPNPPGESQLTPKGVTATAIYYYNITILEQVARLLGKSEDAAAWASLAEKVRQAFNRTFYKAETRQYATGSQAANAMAVAFGLAQPETVEGVIENIVKDVRAKGNHPTAGDVGHRFLLMALARNGRSDVIYDMTRHTEAPSYGNQIQQGATSLTEAWDANPALSQNHFMLGHIEEWFYEYVLGISRDPAGIGFDKIVIRPTPVGDLTWAKGGYRSIRGPIAVEWKRQGGRFTLDLTVPGNTTATVYVPAKGAEGVREGNGPAEKAEGVRFIRMDKGAAVFGVGAGRYQFESAL